MDRAPSARRTGFHTPHSAARYLARIAVRNDLNGPVPLATLDLACLLADSPGRPLDYALVYHLGQSTHAIPDLGPLYRGAQSALAAFPIAGSRLRLPRFDLPVWEPQPDAPPALAVRVFPEGEKTVRIQEFLASPFRPEDGPPLRQLLRGIGDPSSWSLVTQVHHGASDLVGVLLFLQWQLQVARGLVPSPVRPHKMQPVLRETPKRARRNPDSRSSTPLATRSGLSSESRCWRTVLVPREPLVSLSQTVGGFRWNDCLLAAALDALAAWNERQGAKTDRIGLWVPMNVRQERLRDFGNGASRIRVHREPVSTVKSRAFLERCRSVRRMVYRKKRAGEWAVPTLPVPNWMFPIAAPLLRRWLGRPWADFGTAGFTHLEGWPGDEEPVLNDIPGMEVIACLHRRHPIYFVAMSGSDQTAVTITWDPALLRDDDIDFIANAFVALLTDPPFARSGPPWVPPQSR